MHFFITSTLLQNKETVKTKQKERENSSIHWHLYPPIMQFFQIVVDNSIFCPSSFSGVILSSKEGSLLICCLQFFFL